MILRPELPYVPNGCRTNACTDHEEALLSALMRASARLDGCVGAVVGPETEITPKQKRVMLAQAD